MSYTEPDGDSAMRLIEAGHALHRAAVALEGMGPGTLAQSWTGFRLTPNGKGSGPGEVSVASESALDDINTAMAHVDNVNATIASALTEGDPGPPLVTSEAGSRATTDATDYVASAIEDSLQDTLERMGGDLNKVVIRGIFEAALVLQGALQFRCDPDEIQRIEAAIELLDETIRDVRAMVFGFSSSDGSRRWSGRLLRARDRLATPAGVALDQVSTLVSGASASGSPERFGPVGWEQCHSAGVAVPSGVP
jgi:hypothetical protein